MALLMEHGTTILVVMVVMRQLNPQKSLLPRWDGSTYGGNHKTGEVSTKLSSSAQ